MKKTDEQLKQERPELYRIAREQGTEAPFSSEYLTLDADGVFHCAVCGAPLFSSATKYDSGSGWPSFTAPVSPDAVVLHEDVSHGMVRTEVRCATCDAHLGHVFPDGPVTAEAGSVSVHRSDRYCINGISLDLHHD